MPAMPRHRVAEKIRELADEVYDNSDLITALFLCVDLVSFEGEKINYWIKELELTGFG